MPNSLSEDLFAASLIGNIYCLNKLNGNTMWKVSLKKPCFASPSLDFGRKLLFIGCCDCNMYCITFEGEIVRLQI